MEHRHRAFSAWQASTLREQTEKRTHPLDDEQSNVAGQSIRNLPRWPQIHPW